MGRDWWVARGYAVHGSFWPRKDATPGEYRWRWNWSWRLTRACLTYRADVDLRDGSTRTRVVGFVWRNRSYEFPEGFANGALRGLAEWLDGAAGEILSGRS